MTESSSSGACIVHLLHAESRLTLSYATSLDARVDVGVIAAHFALQPNSLRLNGHFISRDSHFVSGLTWRPLLSFFHSRGFNAGTHAVNPVEVQGIPVLQLPMDVSCADVSASKLEESFVCLEKPRNIKRTADLCNPVSPFKRLKQDWNTVETRAMPSCNLKREHLEDDDVSCMWNKRIRQEVNSGVQQGTDELQISKEDVLRGSKGQDFMDDSSVERTRHWKRTKEVKV